MGMKTGDLLVLGAPEARLNWDNPFWQIGGKYQVVNSFGYKVTVSNSEGDKRLFWRGSDVHEAMEKQEEEVEWD